MQIWRWALIAASLVVTGCSGINHGQPPVVRDDSTNSRKTTAAPTAGGPYLSAGLDRPGLHRPEVKAALSRVPRHDFVPHAVQSAAYEDRALPIGRGQTISQPYIVALMTQEAAIKPGAKVLEIGTGSGYQAAVLAELGAEVYTVEIVPELAAEAAQTLDRLGYRSVHVRQGDGWSGWQDQAPFDAIIVTASAPGFPPALLAQLAPGGRMIVPVEHRDGDAETLMVVRREENGFVTQELGGVKFVPLTGEVRRQDTAQIADPTDSSEVDHAFESLTDPLARRAKNEL